MCSSIGGELGGEEGGVAGSGQPAGASSQPSSLKAILNKSACFVHCNSVQRSSESSLVSPLLTLSGRNLTCF